MKRKTILLTCAVFFLIGGFIGTRVQNYRCSTAMQNVRATCKSYVEQLAITADTDTGLPQSAQGKLQLFILAGQSNMSGRGLPIDTLITHPDVYLFGNDFRWRLASEPVDSPVGQVDRVSMDDNAGVSPGMSFALELVKANPGMKIGLIPVSLGGTSLFQWKRNLSDISLYGAFLKRAMAASTVGQFAGFLWYQGEADARNPGDKTRRPMAGKWNEGFEALVSNVRGDLKTDNLPVVFAQIGTHKNPKLYPNWELVQQSQLRVTLANCAMVKTNDLDLMDNVHLTSESYRTVGRRLAHAYMGLAGDDEPSSEESTCTVYHDTY